jgi:RNA polymerase sigma-70 factor (ECF subfamily)
VNVLESPSMRSPVNAVAEAFRAHERRIWGLAYRMTGSTADADDVVQETFARAVEQPPARVDEPLRPWLTRVALNLARDALRRRKRRAYVGPWLPSPVETADLDDAAEEPAAGAEARYDLRESASYAFLVALETLTAQQRAVLLLRDVLDYSVAETAGALTLTEANVRTTHHRARRAMAAYDRTRWAPAAQMATATRAVLERFLTALVSEDAAAAEACLTEAARAVSDGGGEYLAALRPVRGRDRVARFLVGLQRKTSHGGRFALRDVNGLPALVAEVDTKAARWAPRFLLRCDVAADGRIREVHIVAAPSKLRSIGPV